MTQDAGLWELAPSGGIDSASEGENGRIDIKQQLFGELHEETGVTANLISRASPFCLIEDTENHVIGIGIEIATSLSANAIYASHRLFNSNEYESPNIIPLPEIVRFLNQENENIMEVPKILLQERGFTKTPQ